MVDGDNGDRRRSDRVGAERAVPRKSPLIEVQRDDAVAVDDGVDGRDAVDQVLSKPAYDALDSDGAMRRRPKRTRNSDTAAVSRNGGLDADQVRSMVYEESRGERRIGTVVSRQGFYLLARTWPQRHDGSGEPRQLVSNCACCTTRDQFRADRRNLGKPHLNGVRLDRTVNPAPQ